MSAFFHFFSGIRTFFLLIEMLFRFLLLFLHFTAATFAGNLVDELI